MQTGERDDGIVAQVAAAVLDGTPVDWVSAESESDGASRPLIKHLKALAALAEIHRIVHPTLSAGAPATPTAGPTVAPLETWGHLRILEQIGRGAFGEVYRAWDTRLDREVALKLLPANPSSGDREASSIIHEGRLLARVRHPNVVDIHGAEQIGEQIGLWMEFVRGHTLEQALTQQTVLSAAETVDIGLELCRAVGAVHSAGLLHRDIKAHNVMRADDGRIVLMDFGTGRELSDEASSDLAGTPLYLAPEVLHGRPATAGSDVYSLGVLLYHLVTGSYPVHARSIREVRRAHEHGDRAAVHAARGDVPPKLARIIERAIDPDPGRRYQTADALASDLLALKRRPRTVPLTYGLPAAAALVLAVWLAWEIRGSRNQPAGGPAPGALVSSTGPNRVPTPITPRRSVAVLGFRNASQRTDAAWLSTALSEMLTTELAAGEVLRAIPAENVARMKTDLSLGNADSFAKDTLGRIRQHLGADVVVLGSYIVLGARPVEKVRLDLRLQETATGEALMLVSETGTDAELFDVVSRLGARVRERLGAKALSTHQADALRASQPANAEAARLYAQGLEKLRRADYLQARVLLEKAVAADPKLVPARSWLGSSWWMLGNQAKAVAEARRAFELSENLSREERLFIEARYRTIMGERARALEIYRALVNFFPDNVEYRLRVADAHGGLGSYREALDTIDALRRDLPASAEHPRIDYLESHLAWLVQDLKRAEKAAATAERKATALGARNLMADARYQQALNLQTLGEPRRAIAVAEEAARIYDAVGSLKSAATVRRDIADMLWPLGDLARARSMYELTAATYREIGDRANEHRVLARMATMLSEHGDLADAKRVYEGILRTGDKLSLPDFHPDDYLNGMGIVVYRQGELTAAKGIFEKALAISREVGARRYEANALRHIAETICHQGDLSGARQMAERAVAIYRDNAPGRSLASALNTIASILLTQGDLGGARRVLEEALASPVQHVQDKQQVAAENSLAWAAFTFDDGRFADVRPLAQRAADLFHSEWMTDREASAYVVLALASLAQGQLVEAQDAITRAENLVRASQNRLVRLSVGMTAARVRAATKTPADIAEARKRLDTGHREAMRIGSVPLQFDARLALGELEIASGKSTAARAWLAALEREAAAKGFGLVAKKAAALKVALVE